MQEPMPLRLFGALQIRQVIRKGQGHLKPIITFFSEPCQLFNLTNHFFPFGGLQLLDEAVKFLRVRFESCIFRDTIIVLQ